MAAYPATTAQINVTLMVIEEKAELTFIKRTIIAHYHPFISDHATPQTQLLHYLRQKALLLVLDNFEHLLSPPVSLPTATEANPTLALVNGILQEAPAVTLLVTSRERLNLQGEWVYEVGGLEIPDADSSAPAEESSALTLFLQTAAARAGNFYANGG